eukprot:scaffold29291_cov69-Phaeocystis_antarctica.AAC.2
MRVVLYGRAYELYALAEPRQLHVRTRTYIIEQATDISLTPESDKHKATNANNKPFFSNGVEAPLTAANLSAMGVR